MTIQYTISLISGCCALVITLLLLIATLLSGNLRDRMNRLFLLAVLTSLGAVLLDAVVALLAGHTGSAARIVSQAADYGTLVIGALQHVTLAMYIREYLSRKTNVASAPFYAIYCLSAFTIVLATISQFNGMYAGFDAENTYVLNDLYWVALVNPILSVSIHLGIALRYRKKLDRRAFASLLIHVIFALPCLLIELLFPGVWVSFLAGSIALFAIYLLIQVERQQQLQAREAELAESRISVMLSQIQPHFIFNALNTIAKMAYGNQEVYHALVTFSSYLRVNMDSLTTKELIPFSEELAHIRQYLWLEQLRFEERLQIEYDIRTEAFMLPVLTVQPIVENAVRYGVTQRRAGGTLTLRAEETPHGHRITILDDGPGFDPQATPSDGRSHTGISNVRRRLAAMCGGTLTIDSRPGGGTAVTIDLPRQGGSAA